MSITLFVFRRLCGVLLVLLVLLVYGAGEDGLADRITHLTLPAVTLAIVLSAVVVRQTRAATLTVVRQDQRRTTN